MVLKGIMIQELDQWLKGNKNYLAGVALYEKYGDNTTLKGLFRSAHNTWLEGKLISSIQELREKAVAIAPIREPKQVKKEPVRVPEYESDNILGVLNKKKGNLFKEAASLHAHLHHMTPGELKKAAPKILSNFKEINRIWQVIDNYETTGTVPAALTGKLTLKELMMKMKNLPTYITKLKQRIENLPAGKEREKSESQLAIYEAEFEKLSQIVNNDTTIVIQS